jgi:hypothetical protein
MSVKALAFSLMRKLVQPPMYSKIESGKRMIQLNQLESFALHCKCSYSELESLWLADRINQTLSRYNISEVVYQNAISIINYKNHEYGDK